MQKRKKCLCQLLLIILTCWGSVTCFILEKILLKIKIRGKISLLLYSIRSKKRNMFPIFVFIVMANYSVLKIVVPWKMERSSADCIIAFPRIALLHLTHRRFSDQKLDLSISLLFRATLSLQFVDWYLLHTLPPWLISDSMQVFRFVTWKRQTIAVADLGFFRRQPIIWPIFSKN